MASETLDLGPDGDAEQLEARPSMAAVAGHVAMLPSNRPGRRRELLLAMVAVAVVVAVVATLPRFLSGSATASADTEVAAANETATSLAATPSMPTPSPSRTYGPAPAWTANLVGQLDCEGPPSPIGGDVGDVYPEGVSQDSPDAAMETFIANALYASLPVNGWDQTNLDDHWARFAHRVDGSTKAIVVFGDEGLEITTGIWSIAALVACDAAEFAPDSGFTGGLLAVWLDADGKRVPTTTIHEIRGPGHCGWESTIWLRVEGELFLRDPEAVLTDSAVGTFDPEVALPSDATSTGYHEGRRMIWREGNPDSILMVTEEQVERWPRAIDPFMGCA